MTDSGDMRNFDLGPSTSVRLAERDLSDEVEKYLNLMAPPSPRSAPHDHFRHGHR